MMKSVVQHTLLIAVKEDPSHYLKQGDSNVDIVLGWMMASSSSMLFAVATCSCGANTMTENVYIK